AHPHRIAGLLKFRPGTLRLRESRTAIKCRPTDAEVAKLADAPDLGSGGEILRGSSPLLGIRCLATTIFRCLSPGPAHHQQCKRNEDHHGDEPHEPLATASAAELSRVPPRFSIVFAWQV